MSKEKSKEFIEKFSHLSEKTCEEYLERIYTTLKNNITEILYFLTIYVQKNGFYKNTSTLAEAWLSAVMGLINALKATMEIYKLPLEYYPDSDNKMDDDNPIIILEFGVSEAKLHRQRGVSLRDFLSLYQYFRDSLIYCVDMFSEKNVDKDYIAFAHDYIRNFSNTIQIAFSVSWNSLGTETIIDELQTKNRDMTNMKNLFYSIFECSATPVIIHDNKQNIINMNKACRILFLTEQSPIFKPYGETSTHTLSEVIGIDIGDLLLDEIPSPIFTTKKTNPDKNDYKDIFFNFLFSYNKFDNIAFNVTKLINTNKGPRTICFGIMPMYDLSQKYPYYILSLNDISEKVELENIKEKTRLLKKFQEFQMHSLKTTSHELLTPLHGMSGLIQTVLHKESKNISIDSKKSLDITLDSIKNLTTIIQNLVNVNNMDNIILNIEPIKLADTFDVITKENLILVERKKLKVSINIDPSFIVMADQNRLIQVNFNLLNNSIIYSTEGDINVNSTLVDNQYIQVSFSDPGYDSGNEIFGTLGNDDKEPRGFVFYLIQQLVKKMNGHIWVDKNVNSSGCTFFYTLPVTTPPEAKNNQNIPISGNQQNIDSETQNIFSIATPSSKTSNTSYSPRSFNYEIIEENLNIIVIDDDTVALRVMDRFLGKEGYKVKLFSSPLEAYHYCERKSAKINQLKIKIKIKTNNYRGIILDCQNILPPNKNQIPDIALSDIMMPVLNGIQLCTKIRKLPHCSIFEFPILFLSAALNDDQIYIDCLHAGGSGVISKPFSRIDLICRIKFLVSMALSKKRIPPLKT